VSNAYEQSGLLAQVPRFVPPSQVSSVDVAQTPRYSGGTALDLHQLSCYDFSAKKNRLLISIKIHKLNLSQKQHMVKCRWHRKTLSCVKNGLFKPIPSLACSTSCGVGVTHRL